jgi:acetaldehyde dehydrogenase (acetylating)
MSIHSRNEQVILEFGLKKPAFRIVVNTPTTHGSIGLTTGLDPAMTLGCGGWGGNITSDNISPKHLLNIKRLAYELRPVGAAPRASVSEAAALPHAGVARASTAIDAHSMAQQVAAKVDLPRTGGVPADHRETTSAVDFVCEEDVRQAIRLSRRIVIGERTIITPAARDLAEANRVFLMASWPRT